MADHTKSTLSLKTHRDEDRETTCFLDLTFDIAVAEHLTFCSKHSHWDRLQLFRHTPESGKKPTLGLEGPSCHAYSMILNSQFNPNNGFRLPMYCTTRFFCALSRRTCFRFNRQLHISLSNNLPTSAFLCYQPFFLFVFGHTLPSTTYQPGNLLWSEPWDRLVTVRAQTHILLSTAKPTCPKDLANLFTGRASLSSRMAIQTLEQPRVLRMPCQPPMAHIPSDPKKTPYFLDPEQFYTKTRCQSPQSLGRTLACMVL